MVVTLLLAPAGQAHAISTTRFLAEGYRGATCRGLKPGCMTKQQWANHCRKTYPMHHPWPKSCRDAIAPQRDIPSGTRLWGFLDTYPGSGTRFLPDDHKGPTCFALSPSCMTRSQWAEVFKSRSYYVLPKSCRDALGLHRDFTPKPPTSFVPGLKDGGKMTCLALSEACMGRDAYAEVQKTYILPPGR